MRPLLNTRRRDPREPEESQNWWANTGYVQEARRVGRGLIATSYHDVQPWRRDHVRDQHEHINCRPVVDELRGEATEGLPHHEELGAVADRVECGIRVGPESGRSVVAWRSGATTSYLMWAPGTPTRNLRIRSPLLRYHGRHGRGWDFRPAPLRPPPRQTQHPGGRRRRCTEPRDRPRG